MDSNQKLKMAPIIAFVGLIFFAAGCKDKYTETRTYTANDPEYMSYEEMRSAVGSEDARTLQNPGKIFVYDNLLFISETNKGIHVYDNSNPSNPESIKFINIPGNRDIAVKDGILYADSHVDLLAIDLADINSVQVTERLENMFQYSIPEWDERYPIARIDQSKGLVKNWVVREVTETCENNDCGWNPVFSTPTTVAVNEDNTVTAFAGAGGGNGTRHISVANGGIAGSMSRFLVHKDNLYVISDNFNMKLFDISNPAKPSFTQDLNIGRNIETLFGYEDHLFIGSEFGMFIYNIEEPANPVYVSTFTHAQGCDPVVVDGNTAYVTIRTGTFCGGWQNVLDVVDISDLTKPWQLTSYNMDNPQGMGIDGDKDLLFLCDGNSGLKVYGTDDPWNLTGNMKDHVTGVDAYDAIAVNGLLLMIGENGLYQYNYDNPSNLNELSVLRAE